LLTRTAPTHHFKRDHRSITTKSMTRKTNNIGIKRQFSYSAPEARSVLLAGDFTGWADHAVAMKRTTNGDWKASVALTPGRHEYRFIVDGQWVDDPQCSDRATNPYGTANSVCRVG
jgi:1,4-alpha-glucan branching enzyme